MPRVRPTNLLVFVNIKSFKGAVTEHRRCTVVSSVESESQAVTNFADRVPSSGHTLIVLEYLGVLKLLRMLERGIWPNVASFSGCFAPQLKGKQNIWNSFGNDVGLETSSDYCFLDTKGVRKACLR